MIFWAYGPFSVDPGNLKPFWQTVAEWSDFDGYEPNALRNAIGCYVFTLRWGRKPVPYYVGKTNARTGFFGEIFTPHKLRHYKSAIELKPHHKAEMLLFPLMTEQNRFSKSYKTMKPTIEWMERTLIGMALSKNRDLFNLRDTKMLRTCVVDGVFGDEGHRQQYDAALAARRALTDYEITE